MKGRGSMHLFLIALCEVLGERQFVAQRHGHDAVNSSQDNGRHSLVSSLDAGLNLVLETV